eukprot:9086706-Alexandrium_andersonii.AAC.1
MERPDPRLHLLRWGCAHAHAAARRERHPSGQHTPPSEPPSPPRQPPSAPRCAAFSIALHLQAPPRPTR